MSNPHFRKPPRIWYGAPEAPLTANLHLDVDDAALAKVRIRQKDAVWTISFPVINGWEGPPPVGKGGPSPVHLLNGYGKLFLPGVN